MATRSTIAYAENGLIHAVYCHWDGYPESVGRTLVNHYQAARKIGQLIEMGDISALAAEIGQQQDFDDRSTHRPDWTLFYGRDRGEITAPMQFNTVAEWLDHYSDSDYAYIWTAGHGWQFISLHEEFLDSTGLHRLNDLAEHLAAS